MSTIETRFEVGIEYDNGQNESVEYFKTWKQAENYCKANIHKLNEGVYYIFDRMARKNKNGYVNNYWEFTQEISVKRTRNSIKGDEMEQEKKRGRGRPKTTSENKQTTSLRFKPTVKLMLIKRYGSLQKAVDKLIADDLNKMIRGEE